MMVSTLRCVSVVAAAIACLASPVGAGQPKLDKDTCTQLHTEQATFIQSGILADLQRGPAWGKANLSADRLREVEHYIMLDEQIKFACREATLTPELERASEIAKRLEINSDADPFAPIPEPKTEAAPKSPSDANQISKSKPAAKLDDALKVPPKYVAPPPILLPAAPPAAENAR